jgi:hypothetical protein
MYFEVSGARVDKDLTKTQHSPVAQNWDTTQTSGQIQQDTQTDSKVIS